MDVSTPTRLFSKVVSKRDSERCVAQRLRPKRPARELVLDLQRKKRNEIGLEIGPAWEIGKIDPTNRKSGKSFFGVIFSYSTKFWVGPHQGGHATTCDS